MSLSVSPCSLTIDATPLEHEPAFDSRTKSEARLVRERAPLYHVIAPRYHPITVLTTDWAAFFDAFRKIFCGHASLWAAGIEYRGITEHALLWDARSLKPKLIDFDLLPGEVSVTNEAVPRTVPWAFLAEDLLTDRAMEGSVKRVYLHEVEAFVAVLVWIACRYVGGKIRPDPPLEKWNHRDHLHVKGERTTALRKISGKRHLGPSGLPNDLWRTIRSTVSGLEKYLLRARQAHLKAYDDPDSDDETDSDEGKGSRAPKDYDDLRALSMILRWPIFKKTSQPSATLFVRLIKEHIPSASRIKTPIQSQLGPTV